MIATELRSLALPRDVRVADLPFSPLPVNYYIHLVDGQQQQNVREIGRRPLPTMILKQP